MNLIHLLYHKHSDCQHNYKTIKTILKLIIAYISNNYMKFILGSTIRYKVLKQENEVTLNV
jgi:hypothetical protein